MWYPRIRDRGATTISPEAAEAVKDSKRALRRVQARTQEVREVAEASKRFRRENHFAADLQNIFGGKTT